MHFGDCKQQLFILLMFVIVCYSDSQFQSSVHAAAAADRVSVQHHVSLHRYDASFHHGYLPPYKHVRLQDSPLRLPRPFESEWIHRFRREIVYIMYLNLFIFFSSCRAYDNCSYVMNIGLTK